MYTKKILYFLITILLGFSKLYAYDIKYPASTIPKELSENANSVVRWDESTFIQESEKDATLKVKYVITIFNKSHDKNAEFIEYYDKRRKINFQHGKIYNSLGILIRLIKTDDLRDQSINLGMEVSDERILYFEPVIKTYPYTVEYEYEIHYNGLFGFPDWQPINSFMQGVEFSQFNITTPSNLPCRYLVKNFTGNAKKTEANSKITNVWELKNFPPLKEEPYCPDFQYFLPIVYTGPTNFEYEGYKGNATTWENFGKWISGLNKNRNTLPSVTMDKIRGKFLETDSEKEKVKKVYEYVQSKTRYVSVQLGIGGFQPAEAASVDKLGYGDCKGLSYYTKSILDNLGIKSNYVLVKSGKGENIIKEFPSNQFNHVILCVPMKNDTTWLECTNQRMPFGFLGDFTDDRDVLVIDDVSYIAHTPVYNQDQNTQLRKAFVKLDEKGDGTCEVMTQYKALQYENIMDILVEKPEEQRKVLEKNIDIPGFKLNQFSLSENKNPLPEAILNLNLTLLHYANPSGTRYFIPLNLMNKLTTIPQQDSSLFAPIEQTSSYLDVDTIMYEIPSGMLLESKPENISIHSKFGDFSTTIELEGNLLTFIRVSKMNKGIFSNTDYPNFVDFYKKIVIADKSKIVFKKVS